MVITDMIFTGGTFEGMELVLNKILPKLENLEGLSYQDKVDYIIAEVNDIPFNKVIKKPAKFVYKDGIVKVKPKLKRKRLSPEQYLMDLSKEGHRIFNLNYEISLPDIQELIEDYKKKEKQ